MTTFSPKATPAQRQQAVKRLIAELNSNNAPILLGPYRSEVGFEVSYWTPFLAWLSGQVKDFAQRASVITRGGLAPLYTNIAHQGYDLYALRSVTEVRRENLFDAQVRQKGQTIKQVQPTDWDDAVLEDAAAALGITGLYHVVHPAWMYWALAPYWDEQAGLRYLMSMTDFAPLPRLEMNVELPPAYVAVKFYGRATFPYGEPNVSAFVQHTVATLSAQMPVVLLNSGSDHDDHLDIDIAGPNIHRLPDDVPADQNLALQTAVMGHARAFVGTYGGVAQLALRMGLPSVSFYLEWGGTSHAHYALSSWLSKAYKVPFLVGSLRDTGIWKQVLTVPEQALAKREVAA